MYSRARAVFGLFAAVLVGVLACIGFTTPPSPPDGPSPADVWYHLYGFAALLFVGLAALPLVFWLAYQRDHRPGELGWRVGTLVGVAVAMTIGAIGVLVAVHPPYNRTICVRNRGSARKTCTYHPRPERMLSEYGAAALVVLAVTGVAVARRIPGSGVTAMPSQPGKVPEGLP